MRCTLPIGFVLFLRAFLSSCLTAQEAPLRGVVTDATGAVLPNATVILLDSGVVRVATTATGNDGSFSFQAVAPGQYTLAIERFGQ
jgi:hypothetical protein